VSISTFRAKVGAVAAGVMVVIGSGWLVAVSLAPASTASACDGHTVAPPDGGEDGCTWSSTTTTVPYPTTTVPYPTTTVPHPTTTVPHPTTTVPHPTTTAPKPTTTIAATTTTSTIAATTTTSTSVAVATTFPQTSTSTSVAVTSPTLPAPTTTAVAVAGPTAPSTTAVLGAGPTAPTTTVPPAPQVPPHLPATGGSVAPIAVAAGVLLVVGTVLAAARCRRRITN
jgi:LPXTG-motif cell wall-anchored protein